MHYASCLIAGLLTVFSAGVFAADIRADLDRLADQLEPNVIEWRHDIHQNPELGNREFRTAEKVAAHLKSLGLEVQTGVAHTGVVALLKGGKPGPVVALRADMDALPIRRSRFAVRIEGENHLGRQGNRRHACVRP